MPVIFLDIDGVLNRKRPLGGSTHRVVESDLLDCFRRVVRDTGAQVVLASTWRHEAGGLSRARELGIPFDDVLPDLRPRSRGEEIKQWLDAHPGVGRFAAVDNDDDGYGSIPLFQPRPSKGLTPELAKAITAYLKGESDRDLRRSALIRAFQNMRDALLGHRG